MKMNNKLVYILEIVWLVLAILSFLAGLFTWYSEGLAESLMLFIIAIISLFMYFYRRKLRKSQKRH